MRPALPLCGTTAPSSFSGNGAIGSTCAAPPRLHLFLAMEPLVPPVRHHRASIFFWQWSHWFQLRCVLLTTHQCPVSCKQTLITVFACHWYTRWCFISIILFDNLELFKKRRERERAKLSLFHQSQSLSPPLSPSLSHTHIRARIREHHEQLSGQLIQFCDPAVS